MLTMPEPGPVALRRRPAGHAGAGAAAPPRCSSTPRCATSRSWPRSGCRSGRAGSACAAPPRTSPGTIDEPVIVGGRDPRRRHRRARRRRRRRRRRERASTRCSRRRSRARSSERVKREQAAGRRALLRPRRAARARRGARMTVRTTSPTSATSSCSRRAPTRACASSSTCSGMEIEAREGQSVYLRGWGDYQRYVAEADRVGHAPGIGAHGAARVEPRGAAAPRRRDRGDRASARAGSTATTATAPPTASATPTATRSSSTTSASATSPPEHLRPSLRNQPQRYTGRGAAVKRLDHVNLLAADVARQPRRSRRRARLPPLRADRARRRQRDRRLDEPDDRRPRADLLARRARRQRPPAPPRVLGRHARGVPARRRHLPRRRHPDRGRAVQARDRRRASSSTASSRAATAIEVTTGGHFVYDPERAASSGREAERARGQAWGVKTVESFHNYGTPPAGEADRAYALAAGVAAPVRS